ncbi:transcriptional regulator [Cupriavidus sp. 2TAF22]|uniref:transcriptional regulator n=1 Tax=unclassified Cupriavidus TaxID=2640874 RepID=UPI003F9180E6
MTEALSGPLDIAISIAGSQTKLAAELGVSQQNISNWVKSGIPQDKRPVIARKLERLTGGRVTRQMVCPDDWAEIWPELADVPAHPA